MLLSIYRGETVNLNINPSERSDIEKKLNGCDVCNILFEAITAVDIAIGDYIIIDNVLYTLNLKPKVAKTGNNRFAYECRFESRLYELGKILYSDGISSEFVLTGDLDMFMDLLITNLNRVQSGWSKGIIQEGTETKVLQFSDENCLTVLQRLISEYDLDLHVNENKSIDVGEFGSEVGHIFAYGRGHGLYSLTRKTIDSKNIFTRLYPYGGQRNIPANYRNYSNRLKISTDYIEENTETYGIIEAAKTFEDIYPRFKGAVTYIGTNNVFRCSTIDFDVNDHLVTGTSVKIVFNTGALAGYQFEVSTYNHTNKEFTLVYSQQEKVFDGEGLEQFILPNDSIKPAIDDEFVILDISMPDSYITAAEAELLAAAEEFLGENCHPRVGYTLEIDPKYMQENEIDIEVGDYVPIQDGDLGIDASIRVVGLKKSITEPVQWSVDLSDYHAPQLINRLIADVEKIRKIIIVNKLSDSVRARHNWKTTSELKDSIFDTDGYLNMGKIRPLSIETAMISVGSRSGNFTLSSTIIPNYTNDNSKVKLGAGTLVHFQIEEEIRTWTISEDIQTGLVAGTTYYIYARCYRASGTGLLIVDTVQRKVDSDPDYYYFPVGILTSVIDSWRDAIMTYGQSYIVGRQMNVGSITGQNGLVINLDTGQVTGKIAFVSGSSGYGNITDRPTALSQINSSEGTKLAGIATGADVTKTVIDGGVVTTGRLEVGGGALGANNAGVNGSGSVGASIRFWAGDTYANRASAPFRVQQDGTVVMTNATVQSAASGKRVIIDGTNNRLDLYNSSNIKVVTIDDTLYGSGAGIQIISSADSARFTTLKSKGLEIYKDTSQKIQLWYHTVNDTTMFYALDLPQQTPAQNGNLRYLYVDIVTGQIKHH